MTADPKPQFFSLLFFSSLSESVDANSNQNDETTIFTIWQNPGPSKVFFDFVSNFKVDRLQNELEFVPCRLRLAKLQYFKRTFGRLHTSYLGS